MDSIPVKIDPNCKDSYVSQLAIAMPCYTRRCHRITSPPQQPFLRRRARAVVVVVVFVISYSGEEKRRRLSHLSRLSPLFSSSLWRRVPCPLPARPFRLLSLHMGFRRTSGGAVDPPTCNLISQNKILDFTRRFSDDTH